MLLKWIKNGQKKVSKDNFHTYRYMKFHRFLEIQIRPHTIRLGRVIYFKGRQPIVELQAKSYPQENFLNVSNKYTYNFYTPNN